MGKAIVNLSIYLFYIDDHCEFTAGYLLETMKIDKMTF